MHEHSTMMLTTVMDYNKSLGHKGSFQTVDDREKRSSDASLRTMHPVASGDNMAAFGSAHKLKDETPSLVPCCEGKELQINEELVHTGLSAISVRHEDSIIHSLSFSRASERLQIAPGLVKHRNSFRSLHRPDLKRVPYLRRMTPEELESVFKGYNDVPQRGRSDNHGIRPASPPVEIWNQEDAVLHPIPESRAGSEDLPAGMRLHGARARLYTSVLGETKAGDQLDGLSNNEDMDATMDCEEPMQLDDMEVQLYEELQVLLPPRAEDINDGVLTSDHSAAAKSA